MSGQALAALMEWASKQPSSTQRRFVQFFIQKRDVYTNDEAHGANGTGMINWTMMTRMIEEFEEA